jgi:hypothetical protein
MKSWLYQSDPPTLSKIAITPSDFTPAEMCFFAFVDKVSMSHHPFRLLGRYRLEINFAAMN